MEGIKLWEQYVSKALSVASHSNQLNVGYEDFLLDPERQLERLSDFIGVEIFPEKSREMIKTINRGRRFAFIDNAEHLKVYEGIKNRNLLKKLGYDSITT